MNRRELLRGLGFVACAPAIVRVGSLMSLPVRRRVLLAPGEYEVVFYGVDYAEAQGRIHRLLMIEDLLPFLMLQDGRVCIDDLSAVGEKMFHRAVIGVTRNP